MKDLPESGINSFRAMFDLAKQDPFRSNYTSKTKRIIEYTINCPENKNYDENRYKEIISKAVSNFKDDFPLEKETVSYFERCKSGKLHMHGMFRVKETSKTFYVEGLVSEIVKYLLGGIDKRMKVNFERNFYRNYNRYRTPTMCVQYSDEAERILHWEQYIEKNAH